MACLLRPAAQDGVSDEISLIVMIHQSRADEVRSAFTAVRVPPVAKRIILAK